MWELCATAFSTASVHSMNETVVDGVSLVVIWRVTYLLVAPSTRYVASVYGRPTKPSTVALFPTCFMHAAAVQTHVDINFSSSSSKSSGSSSSITTYITRLSQLYDCRYDAASWYRRTCIQVRACSAVHIRDISLHHKTLITKVCNDSSTTPCTIEVCDSIYCVANVIVVLPLV